MGQIRDIKEQSFRELFKDSFYVIPTYQRMYSWDEYNLNALWEDIVSIRETIAKQNFTENESHFMSSVLVKEVSDGASLKKHVVDGQQRMTTMFLMFHAALDILNEKEESLKGDFYRMVRKNLMSVLYGEDYQYDKETGDVEEVKIPRLSLQNQEDSHPFTVLVTTGAASWTNKHQTTKTVQTYSFFRKKLGLAFQESHKLFKETIDASLNNLHLIYIPILQKEAPQKIFESVNGLTKKLYAGELVKNFALLSVTSEQESYDLYRDYWAEFDKELWTEDDKAKERLTKFLYYWVSSKGVKIKTDDESVYRGFKKACNLAFYSESEVIKQVRAISADVHRSILTLTRLEEALERPSSRLEISYSRLYSMKNALNSKSVFIQLLRVIHFLENHYGKLNDTQMNKLLLPIESYIVRKALSPSRYSGATTEYLVDTINKVLIPSSETDHETADDYLEHKVKQLCDNLSAVKEAGKRFESTEYLLDYITGNKKKGLLPKEFDQSLHPIIRMLLIQAENHLRKNSFTPDGASLSGNFSLEHWLPQSSTSAKWPLAAESSRSIYTNSIGNLCIIPQSINSHLSNNSLEEKLEKVIDILAEDGHEKTGLHTFDKVIDLCLTSEGIVWDEDQIDSRAKWLMRILLDEVFKDVEHFTGKKREEAEGKYKKETIWDNPVEGRRIVAKARGTVIRGYQTLEGVLTIDEVTGINPIPNPSFKEYYHERRAIILSQSTLQPDGTYNWKGELVCPNRTGWLAVFVGTPMSDEWKLE